MKPILYAAAVAGALTLASPAWAVMTTTSVAAGTTDWADGGVGAATATIQTTKSDVVIAIADVKPSVTPAIGFHLAANVLYVVTLPALAHIWVYQGANSSGGYLIIAK